MSPSPRSIRAVLFTSLAILAGARVLAGVDAPAQGLAVGATVPAVVLSTETGEPFDLRAAVREQPTVLIFYRGGWCPFCNVHLGALNEIVADLRAAGYQLLAISPDQPARLYDAPKREERPDYVLLSDQDAKAMDAFGISFVVPDELVAKYRESYGIDIERDSGRKHHKLPHPAVFLVDRSGVIRFAHIDPDYKKRLEPAKIMAAVRALERN